MRSPVMKMLILCALAAAVSSCGSRVETHLRLPPAADLKPAAEPLYPIEALEPGDAGKAAEDAWWNDVLIWGRGERAKVKRICDWADTLGRKHNSPLPEGWCS